jgi:hypothetical protein
MCYIIITHEAKGDGQPESLTDGLGTLRCIDTGYGYADTDGDTAILHFSKSRIRQYGKYIYYK